jgi:hypothetical protein
MKQGWRETRCLIGTCVKIRRKGLLRTYGVVCVEVHRGLGVYFVCLVCVYLDGESCGIGMAVGGIGVAVTPTHGLVHRWARLGEAAAHALSMSQMHQHNTMRISPHPCPGTALRVCASGVRGVLTAVLLNPPQLPVVRNRQK